MYDLTIDRKAAEALVSAEGWDALLADLEVRAQRDLDRVLELYAVSTAWAHDVGIRVIKARGARGDLLVALR